jgi:predicted metal-dependent hydrolase
MTDEHIINIIGIGPVLMEHSKRAKRLVISIRPTRGIRVAVPGNISLKEALEFVHLKLQWIQKHMEKIKQHKNQQRALANSIGTIDRIKAKKRLLERLSHLAEKYGFTYNNVYTRNQKTRWGSCSRRNNISLNMKLILLPQELRDYVILHELVHTKIHNHSKKFWIELDKYTGNSKAMAKRLRMNDSILM